VAQVDLAAITANYQAVCSYVRTPCWPVIKADAYGHGAVEVASRLSADGAGGFCVALVEEGVALRKAGITVPILAMSGVYRDGLDEALAHGLTPVIHDASQLDELARIDALGASTTIDVHLKIDTGMSRLGILPAQLDAVLARLVKLRSVRLRGLMTHFANADCDDPSFTDVQMDRFLAAQTLVRRAGLDPKLLHAANSAGAFRFERARMDFVRVGIAIYGVAPFAHAGPALLPAMSLKTEILALREVPPGTAVGYGGAHVCAQSAILATIPIGYADGFFRRLSSAAEVLVRGCRARVVANVSMDMASVDVTEIAAKHGICVGDEVILLGSQSVNGRHQSIRAEEIATRVGTIPYEILCALSRRVPRHYVDHLQTESGLVR
jgi:alanine racemase